jgi:hypothetical protein
MKQPVFTEMDLFTMAVAVTTMAEIYRIHKAAPQAQAAMDRVAELLKPFKQLPK